MAVTDMAGGCGHTHAGAICGACYDKGLRSPPGQAAPTQDGAKCGHLCIACGKPNDRPYRVTCSACYETNGVPAPVKAPAPAPTASPLELATFAESCKALGMRTAKGEFVASDGTRMPYDWAFEPTKQKKGREE